LRKGSKERNSLSKLLRGGLKGTGRRLRSRRDIRMFWRRKCENTKRECTDWRWAVWMRSSTLPALAKWKVRIEQEKPG
jgi:hypothetical protein